MSKENPKRVNVPMLLTVVAVVLMLAAGGYSVFRSVNEVGNISKGMSNCRQVSNLLQMYATDHNGKYPDSVLGNPQTSNEVFRVLYKEEYVDSEFSFGCPFSPYRSDGDLGPAPDYARALEANENHWAMTAGLSKDSPGGIPLVYENPVTASWPPRWNASAKGTATRGRAWSKGVIIGLNDGSMHLKKLDSSRGTSVGLAKDPKGKDVFEAAIDPVKFPKGVVLDVLKKSE
ncbi:MAG TPA: hypothetical protein VLE43_02550 [Candidatus Saccharimonadia bacterium]|nr:hypothetical protein [Candidatus Saccharimonadia bacterium]